MYVRTLGWTTMFCKNTVLDAYALQQSQVNYLVGVLQWPCRPAKNPFIDCLAVARAETHLRAWRPRWASVQWWAWLDSSSPRPGRPLTKRRHLGGGGGSHSLAQSFIPRNGATGQSAQGRLPGSQNGAKCSAHTAVRGDGCHRREQNSPGFKGPSPAVHHPADSQHGRSGSAN